MSEKQIKIELKKLKPKFIELHKKICDIINPMIYETDGLDVQSQIELIFVVFTVFCKMAGISGESLFLYTRLNEIRYTNLDEQVLEMYAQLGKEIFGENFHEKSPPESQC